jgi:hypothetical protein
MLCNDITEHKLLKEVVTEYKKIESVGHLAASIAQQINPTGQSPREDIPYLQNTCTNLRMLLDKCKQLFSDNNFKYIQKFPGRSLRH